MAEREKKQIEGQFSRHETSDLKYYGSYSKLDGMERDKLADFCPNMYYNALSFHYCSREREQLYRSPIVLFSEVGAIVLRVD